MGWSWGTSIAGSYTSGNNDKVNRLVLYAPQWIRNEPPPPAATDAPPLGAYRLVSKDSAKARWLKGVPADKQADLIPPGVFEAWANATWATDPESSKQNPPMLRAPNGVAEDSMNYWSAGKALYDPGKITVPTLLLHAEWDADLPSYLAHGYFAQLKNTPYKRLIELSEGTHTVMMEKNRMQFFRELMGFLDEEKQPHHHAGERKASDQAKYLKGKGTMMKTLQIICAVLLLLLGCSQVSAEDPRELVSGLKQGGYVVVFRHVATDDSQKDIYPFDFDDMKAQRQLSEKGG